MRRRKKLWKGQTIMKEIKAGPRFHRPLTTFHQLIKKKRQLMKEKLFSNGRGIDGGSILSS